MSSRIIVAVVLLAVGVAAFVLQRKGSRRLEAGIVLVLLGSVLLLDDIVAGPIPGSWGLSGAGAIGLGVRMLLDWRSASRVRA